jgi:flavodoxin I
MSWNDLFICAILNYMNIKIIFETQTGTTQYVAETIQKQLTAAGHQVLLHSVKYDGPQPALEGVDAVIFGAPTYDDGMLEKTMREFIRQYSPDLSTKKIAVFGLGNSTYPQFCVAADMLNQWVRTKGGQPLLAPLKVDGFPDDLTPITTWVQQLLPALQ